MNLALFDFDGTITHREMFADFIRFAVPRRRHWLGGMVFGPMYAGYKLGVVSGNAIRASVVKFGLRGMRADHAREMGRRFSNEVLPTALRPVAMERIRWHRTRGDKIVVVSGALDVYLEHWCRAHELDLLCSRLEIVRGTLTGHYDGLQCVGAEKTRRVREACELQRYSEVYAYGDTHEDMDMLGMASRKFYRWQEMA